MSASTESIMQNLFAIAQAVANVPSTATPFVTVSRRMRHFKDVAPEQMPAFFQFQNPVRNTTGGFKRLPKDMIGVSWIVYLPGSQSLDDVVSPALNNYYDALSDALLTARIDPGSPPRVVLNGQLAGMGQTLGGLVTACYKDGDGLTDEGLLDTPSLIHIPIRIQVGI
jgi:hypothetical protein